MVWSQMTRLHCVVLAQNRPVRGGITAYLAYENFNPINSFSLNSKYYNNLFLCVFNVWTKSSRRFKQESATDTARIKKYRNTLRSSMTPFYLFNLWTLQSLRIHCLQILSTNALVALVPRQQPTSSSWWLGSIMTGLCCQEDWVHNELIKTSIYVFIYSFKLSKLGQ
jgi:hypothetical protein